MTHVKIFVSMTLVSMALLGGLSACGKSSQVSDLSDKNETTSSERPVNEVSEGAQTQKRSFSEKADVILDSETDAVLGSGSVTKPEYKLITLIAYECGDNCYIHYFPNNENGRDEFALCQADICEDWNKGGLLPASLEKTQVEARFSTGNQVDGSGDVISHNYPAITDIKISKTEPVSSK